MIRRQAPIILYRQLGRYCRGRSKSVRHSTPVIPDLINSGNRKRRSAIHSNINSIASGRSSRALAIPTIKSIFKMLLTAPYINSGTLGSLAIDNQAIATFDTAFLKHQVVLGVDYQNYQYNHQFLEGYTNGMALPALSLTNPVYSQSIPLPNFLLGTSTRQSTDQTGLYAQDQIGIGKLTIVGGLR